MKIIA